MTDPQFQDSIVVARAPEQVYAMVSDITRMGEWSPVCRACWWNDPGPGESGPRAGDRFTGRNETPERTWETVSQVVVAEPGREFAFEVNGGWSRWGYAVEPADGGTRLTESWHFLPAGLAGFQERYGADAEAQIALRIQAAHDGIPQTLAAIKAAAEAG